MEEDVLTYEIKFDTLLQVEEHEYWCFKIKKRVYWVPKEHSILDKEENAVYIPEWLLFITELEDHGKATEREFYEE
jgi:hypothetical protein